MNGGTVNAGRYDILKTLEQAYQDRGHKYSLEAKLGNVADQYRKDMRAVKILLDFAKEAPGGIRSTVLMSAIEEVERFYPLYGMLCGGCNVRAPFEHRCAAEDCPCVDCIR